MNPIPTNPTHIHSQHRLPGAFAKRIFFLILTLCDTPPLTRMATLPFPFHLPLLLLLPPTLLFADDRVQLSSDGPAVLDAPITFTGTLIDPNSPDTLYRWRWFDTASPGHYKVKGLKQIELPWMPRHEVLICPAMS